MLQFITHSTSVFTTEESARMALEGGCRWIQLRMKNAEKSELLRVAQRIKALCDKYEAVFIVDDHLDIANLAGAHGVHLGKKDMPLDEARKLCPKPFIIGGTANDIDDIIRLAGQGADYIGLGPFRFTSTKKNLSPILGLSGYQSILADCRKHHINLPVIAIGGITTDDIPALMQTGVAGIALSSTILQAEKPINKTQEIIKILKQWKNS